MSPAEFRAARLALGLSAVELAQVLACNERTVRMWEDGQFRGRPTRVPHMAAVILRLLVKYAAVRRELGVALEPEPRRKTK